MESIPLEQQVQLEVTELIIESGSYQTLAINLSVPVIETKVLAELELPKELDLNREVILFGQAPNWLYSYLVERCHQAPLIGCYAAREKQVVLIQSQISGKTVGDAVPVLLNQTPCPAILIGGFPDSGKSVLSNALRLCITKKRPQKQLFLHRANWDGQGNWTYETSNRELVKRQTRENEYRVHEHPQAAALIPNYFQYHALAVSNLRELVDLVLVDVGGVPQIEKTPLVEQCTHYIIISRDSEAIAQWHNLCSPTLKPLAVIHSVRDEQMDVVQEQPFLEIVAGSWEEGKTLTVPDRLLEQVLTVVGNF